MFVGAGALTHIEKTIDSICIRLEETKRRDLRKDDCADVIQSI